MLRSNSTLGSSITAQNVPLSPSTISTLSSTRDTVTVTSTGGIGIQNNALYLEGGRKQTPMSFLLFGCGGCRHSSQRTRLSGVKSLTLSRPMMHMLRHGLSISH